MNIKKTVEQVASISRLKLSDSEIKKYAKDLEEILSAFKKIDKVNTDNVKPSFQPIEIENVTRKDVVEKSLSRKEALSNVKNKKDGYFKGPKVA